MKRERENIFVNPLNDSMTLNMPALRELVGKKAKFQTYVPKKAMPTQGYFDLEMRVSRSVSEEDRFFRRIECKIIFKDEDSINEQTACSKVGTCSATLIKRSSMANSGFSSSFFQECDDFSYEVAHMAGCLLDAEDGSFKPELDACGFDDDYNSGDILLIERVEVEESYKGMGLGLMATHEMTENFMGGSGVVVIKALPLQVEKRKSKEIVSAAQKMQEYFSLLGFSSIPNTKYMVMSLIFQRPTIKQVCPHLFG